MDYDVHLAVDNPYWSVPATSGQKGIGLFEGSNLPVGVNSLVDYQYDYDVETDEMGLDVHDMSIHKLCDLKDAFDDDISWSILQSSCEKTDFYSTK